MNPAPVTEKHPAAQEAMRRWDDLKTERTRFEQEWEDIARLIRPQRGGFSLTDHSTRIMEKPLSSAPIVAQSNFASGLYGTLTNPANRWMGMKTNDADLNAWKPMADWLDVVTDRILASFQPSVSPFYSAATQVFGDLSCFGNAAQYDEVDTQNRKIMDVTLSLAEVVYDIDAYGRVCEVVRKFHLKPHAAVALFGAAAVPAKVLELAQKNSNDKHAYFHHVKRNHDWMPRALGPRGKAWQSIYACQVGDSLLRQRGYDEMPFFAPRWEVESGFVYGTGPGYIALPSARMNQQMDAATLRAAQRAADPTILAPDRDTWPINGQVRPGAVVFGGVNPRGEAMLRPFDVVGNINLTFAEKQAKIDEIRDAFNYTLMNLAGRTGMTATEVMTINEERLRLWAPHMGRVQEEYLAPKIERRFSLLWRNGQIPPPPEGAEGVALQVDYQSAAAMAQKSTEGNSALRLIEDLAPLIGIKPRIADRLDDDGLVEVLHAARGAPSRLLRSREQADDIAQMRAQQQQEAQAMQMAQAGAGALRDVAGAAQAMEGGGA
jgi:hypothetical protein